MGQPLVWPPSFAVFFLSLSSKFGLGRPRNLQSVGFGKKRERKNPSVRINRVNRPKSIRLWSLPVTTACESSHGARKQCRNIRLAVVVEVSAPTAAFLQTLDLRGPLWIAMSVDVMCVVRVCAWNRNIHTARQSGLKREINC